MAALRKRASRRQGTYNGDASSPQCSHWRDELKAPDQSRLKENGAAGVPAEDANTRHRNNKPRSLNELVGQTEVVRRLTALVEITRRNEEVFPHTLLLGTDGCGKKTLAHIIAREMGVNVRETSSAAIDRVGDLAGIITDLDKGDILLIVNIGRLRNQLVDPLASTLRTFELDIMVGKGPGARAMKLALKPFTLIATAERENDCPRELLNSFDVVLPFQRYREAEIVELANRFAAEACISIDLGAASVVANLAEGNPGKAEILVRRLKMVERQPISESDAQKILSIFGRGTGGPEPSSGIVPSDWRLLSGIEFEELITAFLKRMGFTAEMTKATGDGGVDIEATLDRPIIGGRYLFQCKRFAADALVGSAAVREFYGALIADRKAVKGVFITTSGFTPHAREFAQNLPIELIDGEQLARLIADNAEMDPSKPKSTP
jgi:Holliday junction resolvasome RuvABC ATP-dependent DNA helicase subunit